jgi:lambda family phage tail tape measure protein
MARNRIEELLVQLKFEGGEELKKIASGFRELGRATTLTDTQIESARKQINEYAKSLNNSEQALKGQIQALQTLRTQATVGGNVYSQLANDVTRLSKTLKSLEQDYKAVGRAAEQTDRQIANQFPARRPEAFRIQLAALRRELDGISVSARAYGDKLTEITIRETAFGRAQARQGVIAGAQAVGAPLIGAMTPEQELPKTTAALSLRLVELREDLQNTNYTLRDYKQRLSEIKTVQQELDRVTGEANKARKDEINDRIANLRAINAENDALRARDAVSRSIERNRAKRAGIAGRGLTGEMFGPEAPSELFRSIGAISGQAGANAAQLMGRTYGEVAQQIRTVAASSDGSVRSLQQQRDAWQQLRTTISPLSVDYGKVAREADQAMAAIDRRMQRMQGRRRRLGAMEATQAAGAVISGGIFGGPEGAIGGAIGTAVGGVPGAFAGAAIGAQAGMIRQSLGQMAAFTAEIDKQRIALRNVVGSQAEYEKSLQFIDATSRRLAIPQDQLNKQFTQLSASVIGAGGNVDAAKLAFEGIAAGIRGTGGNLNDMEAALRATAQVFSKGKVSAEELRQQIGERLPGAFTLFAQSIGKTPQELDKLLEGGEVGLNDFMKFVQALSTRYGSSANEIAASSQAAGDRIQVTFARLREAVGRELQPVGAQFQEIVSNILIENEQNIINFAASIAAIAKTIADNSGVIVGGLKALLGLGAIAAAIPIATNAAAAFVKVSAAIAQMGGIAGTASLAVQGLKAALLGISPFGWVAAGVVGLGLLGKAVYDTNEIFRNWVDNIGNVVAGDFKRSMEQIKEDGQAAASDVGQAFENLGDSLSPAASFIQQLFDDVFGSVSQSGQVSAENTDSAWADAFSNMQSNASAAFNGLSSLIANWWQNLPAPIRSILGGNTAGLLAGAAQYAAGASSRAAQGGPVGTFGDTGGFGRYGAPSSQVRFRSTRTRSFNFGRGTGAGDGGGKGGGKGAKGPESRAAELRIELNLMDQLLEAESLISQAKLAGDEREAAILQTLVAQTRLVSEAAKLDLEKIPSKDKELRLEILKKQSIQESAKLVFSLAEQEKKANDELKKSMETASKQMAEFKDRASFEREYGELIAQGTLPATARQYLETKKVVEETIRAAEAALVKAQADGASADEIERQRKELERIKGEGKAEQDRIASNDSPSTIIGAEIERIQGGLNELLNVGNQVVGAATAIGDAFGNAFKGVITGSVSAKEALAGFFSSVAEYFADMAAKMIAEWIKLAILNTIVRIFNPTAGAAAGGAGLSDLSAPASINNPLGVLNANGNAFAQNGIVPYAKGGIVNSPTLFKFARGSAMATGVMGEAGPEAIMPLKRGPDGKLGVAGGGSGATTVNVSVDAKGTQVQGDSAQGAALGRVIAGAVQAELIKQQRPGGLLSGGR